MSEIKPWLARLEVKPINTSDEIEAAMQAQINDLTAALAERDAKLAALEADTAQRIEQMESQFASQRRITANALDERAKLAAGAAPVPMELEGIAETLKEGSGLWMTCNGCHESNEGYPTGPFSALMNCTLGGGCSECGGIGAVWDTTDYEEMAESMACDLRSAAPEQPNPASPPNPQA